MVDAQQLTRRAALARILGAAALASPLARAASAAAAGSKCALGAFVDPDDDRVQSIASRE